MINQFIKKDFLIFKPGDVDLTYSPLRGNPDLKTYVLGAFNPGFCRLPNGNLLMMVRVAEALANPLQKGNAYSIRWDPENGYIKDGWPVESLEMLDVRKFRIKDYDFPVYVLTSLSWLLPVELAPDASYVLHVHYDKIISPSNTGQEYGLEDPRISMVEGRYVMTVCSVSSERHSTIIFESEDGLHYKEKGIVLDHQNKDMLIFEGKLGNRYYALTRPLGECYFGSSPDSPWHPGAAIHLASSTDKMFWKPNDFAFLRARKNSSTNVKIGGGSPPVLTEKGWLVLYHGVEKKGAVGIYRTYWAILDSTNPLKILELHDQEPLLEANPLLTSAIQDQMYISDVVFTTGIVASGDEYFIASGEADLACRVTIMAKDFFNS
jgi:predicted GH43/DUF377 family glycosyl hydrolase